MSQKCCFNKCSKIMTVSRALEMIKETELWYKNEEGWPERAKEWGKVRSLIKKLDRELKITKVYSDRYLELDGVNN